MRKQAAIKPGTQAIPALTHLGVKAGFWRAVGNAVAALTSEPEGFWVGASDSVYVSKGRANEIPKIMEEHRKQEYDRVRLLTYVRRI